MVVDMRCLWCEEELTDESIQLYSSFCSVICKNKYKKHETAGFKDEPDITTSNKGALGEYAVAADLIRRGFKVFKGITPGAAFDLVVEYNENLLRVEVKTGRRNKNTGNLSYGNTNNNRYEILAVYDLGTGDIWYEFQGIEINDFKP